MITPTKKTAAITAAIALSLGGGAYAATSALTSPTALTGNITDKISAAALAKYPGATLTGVESEPGGTYDAHITKSDGSQLDLTLDKDFNVTGTRAGGFGHGGPGGGHGGFGHGLDTAALAKSLGIDESKVTAALQKVQTAQRASEQSDRAAAIAKALGVSQSDVQAVLDAQKPAAGQRGPGGHDDSALVSALAAKFNVSTDKVQTALDSARPDHGDRDSALATALAKELGVDASKVTAALAAQHP